MGRWGESKKSRSNTLTRPRKTLIADEILSLIEDPTINFVQFRLRNEAPIKELIAALQMSRSSDERQVICDVLGYRYAKSAISVLIDCLDDESSGVRSSAADSLAKIGDSRAGAPLLHRFTDLEQKITVRRMLAVALGAVHYRPAIPFLIEALRHDDLSIRGSAAWSLGNL